jgi:branched-chain amino acid transport system substrate-binding protein
MRHRAFPRIFAAVSATVMVASLTGIAVSQATASAAAKSTVKIGAIIDLSNTEGGYTQYEDAFLAAIKADNAAGGISGHKIIPVVCDSQNDANATAACGRTMASDHVVYAVGLTYGGEYGAYLKAAGIPFGGWINDPALLTNSYMFSTESGGLAGIPALAAAGAANGCKNIVLVDASQFTASANTSIADSFNSIAKAAGIQSSAVFVQTGLPDYSSAIASAMSGGQDCLSLDAQGADEIGLVKAAEGLSKVPQIFAPAYTFDATTQASIGSSVMSTLHFIDIGVQSTATSIPQVKFAVNAINKYAPKSTRTLTGGSLFVVGAVQLGVYGAEHAKSLTAKGSNQFLSHDTHYVSGLIPPINLEKAPANPLGPRLIAPYNIVLKWKAGQFYDSGEFFNTFTGKSVAS